MEVDRNLEDEDLANWRWTEIWRMRILQIGGGQVSVRGRSKGILPVTDQPRYDAPVTDRFYTFLQLFYSYFTFVYIRTKDNCSDDIRAEPSICMITRFVGSQSRVLTINTPPLSASPSSPSTTQKAGRAQVCELHDKHDHSSLKTSARACFT